MGYPSPLLRYNHPPPHIQRCRFFLRFITCKKGTIKRHEIMTYVPLQLTQYHHQPPFPPGSN